MDYFSYVVNRLTFDDLSVMHILYEHDSVNVLKAMSKQNLASESDQKDFTFKRTLSRLEALGFIEIVSGKKHHQYFVTEFGQQAIQIISEGVEE